MKEEQFAQEFLKRGGLKELIDVIHSSHGNTLAVKRSGSCCYSRAEVFPPVCAGSHAAPNGTRLWVV